MKIIIDAMGGDNAPKAPVLGAIEAAELWGSDVILVGREDEIRAVAKEAGYNIKPDGSPSTHHPQTQLRSQEVLSKVMPKVRGGRSSI